MAKLQRKTQKIFSSSSAANEHAVFGTMKNIVDNEQPQYSMDVEVLQDSTAFLLGWQNAVVAGFAPFLEEMNGIFYVITSQIAYLLNNGVAEYDTNTTYYQGDIIKVINDGVPTLKYSVIDDNTGNDTDDTNYWTDLISNADIAIATTKAPGIVQPDGATITITPQGVISAQGGANTDLSNLTSTGNAKFQYAPFSINNGNINAEGNNETLYLPEGTAPVEVNFDQPVLSSNGTLGGDSFAVDAGSYSRDKYPYYLFAGNYYQSSSGIPQWYTFYNPDALKVTKITLQNYDNPTAGNMYSITSGIVYASNDNSSWTQIKEFTSPNTSPGAYWDIDLIENTNYYNYYKIQITGMNNTANGIIIQSMNINAVYLAQVSSATDLLSAPCTITTADNRSKTFTADNLLDCSSVSDGTYKVMKNYTDGSLNLVNNLYIQKTEPAQGLNNDIWLDTSVYPLNLKQYNGTEWITNNNLVYTGDVTISSGVITAINNNEFNDCGYWTDRNTKSIFEDCLPDLTKGISKSTSGFTAEANGWVYAYLHTGLSSGAILFVNGKELIAGVSNGYNSGFIPVKNGDIITITNNAAYSVTFYPVRRNV